MCIPSTAPAPLWSSSAVVIADELNLRFANASFYLIPTKGSLQAETPLSFRICIYAEF